MIIHPITRRMMIIQPVDPFLHISLSHYDNLIHIHASHGEVDVGHTVIVPGHPLLPLLLPAEGDPVLGLVQTDAPDPPVGLPGEPPQGCGPGQVEELGPDDAHHQEHGDHVYHRGHQEGGQDAVVEEGGEGGALLLLSCCCPVVVVVVLLLLLSCCCCCCPVVVVVAYVPVMLCSC